MLRRKRLPEDLIEPFDAFLAVVGSVERAKAMLADSVPTTRFPGRPLAEALIGSEEELKEARRLMEAWRIEALEQEWAEASNGLDTALAMAERIRLEAPELGGFEGLIGTVQVLMDPLEAFGAAAERFRALRA